MEDDKKYYWKNSSGWLIGTVKTSQKFIEAVKYTLLPENAKRFTIDEIWEMRLVPTNFEKFESIPD